MELNNTPVRTAKNFGINNIIIEEDTISKKFQEFDNVYTVLPEGVKVEEVTSNFTLEYGIASEKLEEVKQNANNRTKLIIEKKITEPIELNAEFDEDNLSLIENIEIVAEENTKANLLLKYTSQDEETVGYHNAVIRVKAKKDSNININFVNLLNTKSTNLVSFELEIEENANVKFVVVDFGGKNSITNYYSNLRENSSKNKIYGIYLGKNEQVFDLNYIGRLNRRKNKYRDRNPRCSKR